MQPLRLNRKQIVLIFLSLSLVITLGFSTNIQAQTPHGVNAALSEADNTPLTIADIPPALQSTLLETLGQQISQVALPLTISRQQAKLTAQDGEKDDSFGWSVAISGNTAIVGAHWDDDFTGAVYIFEKPITGWANATQTAKLTAQNGEAGDNFGYSVAISGDTVVIGASGDNVDQGAAYIFEKPASGWANATQTAKLTASDGRGGGFGIGDTFGYSTAINGDTVVVGALGAEAAYVIEKPINGWSDTTEVAKLTARGGLQIDFFGTSVALNNDTVIVGDHWVDGGRGAAYLFEKPAIGWVNSTETVKLTASDRMAFDHFGRSVALNGEIVVIGARGDNSVTGMVYLFEKPASGWANAIQIAKLTAEDTETRDDFGWSVAISGDKFLVGARNADSTGAAYIFEKPPAGNWADATQVAKLTATDRETQDIFGAAVALSEYTAIVGAWGDNDDIGAAYIFTDAPAPEIVVSGNPNFGQAIPNKNPVQRTFTIANTGSKALTLGTLTLTGPHVSDFIITGQPTSPVPAGGRTTFQLSFSPSALGLRTVQGSLPNNHEEENPYTFTLEGTGVEKLSLYFPVILRNSN